jgi:hypothetical protein
MADEPPDDDDLRRAIQHPAETRQVDGVIPFTRPAHDALNQRIADYADDLVEESARVARRRHSPDIVSISDVELAIEHLGIQPRRRRARMVGTIGALLLGAALGNVLQIAGASTVSQESALATFIFGTIGAAMTVFGYLRD